MYYFHIHSFNHLYKDSFPHNDDTKAITCLYFHKRDLDKALKTGGSFRTVRRRDSPNYTRQAFGFMPSVLILPHAPLIHVVLVWKCVGGLIGKISILKVISEIFK